MLFCVHFGYFNLVCVWRKHAVSLWVLIQLYCCFFFSNTWPSWFAENHFCTRLQSFNKYCHHVLDVVNWGFIKNIVKSRIFNAHFFEKHPLILKKALRNPLWASSLVLVIFEIRYLAGMSWQSFMESFKFAVRYHYPTTLTQKNKVFHWGFSQ